MCLSVIYDYFGDGLAPHYGWKIFKLIDGQLYSLFQGKDYKTYPTNKILHRDDYLEANFKTQILTDKIVDGKFKSYPLGFHIYTSEEAVKQHFNVLEKLKVCQYLFPKNCPLVIKNVTLFDVHTIGFQSLYSGLYAQCLVGDKMVIRD